jgi:hypothetical protein
VLRGVNTEGPQYDCAQSGAGFTDDPTVTGDNFTTEIAAMKEWGINIVRVNLNEECWLGINGVPSTTSATGYPIPSGDTYDTSVNAYMNWIGEYVDALNAAGIYAELDLHLNAPGTELIADTGTEDFQNPLPESNSDAFWKSVAAYFSDNHAVIFGVFNEPFPPNPSVNGDTTTGWGCDLNGCTVPDYTDTSNYNTVPANCPTTAIPAPTGCYVGEGMKQMISDIRQYNKTTPLLVGGPDFAGDMDQWLAYFYPDGKSIDPSNQLAASVHIYFPDYAPCSVTTDVATACPSPDSNAIMQVAAVTPVVIDEVGNINCSSSSVFPFLQSVDQADATDGVDIGYLGWAWTTSKCDPNLLSSWKTGSPSAYGEAEYCELLDLGLAPETNELFDPSSYCTGSVPNAEPK